MRIFAIEPANLQESTAAIDAAIRDDVIKIAANYQLNPDEGLFLVTADRHHQLRWFARRDRDVANVLLTKTTPIDPAIDADSEGWSSDPRSTHILFVLRRGAILALGESSRFAWDASGLTQDWNPDGFVGPYESAGTKRFRRIMRFIGYSMLTLLLFGLATWLG